MKVEVFYRTKGNLCRKNDEEQARYISFLLNKALFLNLKPKADEKDWFNIEGEYIGFWTNFETEWDVVEELKKILSLYEGDVFVNAGDKSYYLYSWAKDEKLCDVNCLEESRICPDPLKRDFIKAMIERYRAEGGEWFAGMIGEYCLLRMKECSWWLMRVELGEDAEELAEVFVREFGA